MLFSTTMPVVQRAENCSGPAVVARFYGGRCPCCRFLRLWTPCDHAAGLFSSTVVVPQMLSPESVDIPVVQQRRAPDFQPCWLWRRCRGFRRILRHFSRSSGYPGVERQFFEPSMMKSSSSSRARGWRGRRESDCQAFCHLN